MILVDQHHLYIPKSDLEPADCPPMGYHYDPYTKAWRKNLTEAEVQNLWPYAKKEAPTVEPIDHWIEDALGALGDKRRPDELHEAPATHHLLRVPPIPVRLNDGPAGSAAMRVPKEKVEELAEATAFINEVVSSDVKAGDNVHLPQHYARYKIEPIRFSIENDLDGFQFNIIKYVCRHPFKNKREDLRKAMRYLEMYIKYTYDNDPDWWK